MVLYNAFVLSWGLTITQNSIHTILDLDRSNLSDTRSAENDRIGADTDPEYRIGASLVVAMFIFSQNTFQTAGHNGQWASLIKLVENI